MRLMVVLVQTGAVSQWVCGLAVAPIVRRSLIVHLSLCMSFELKSKQHFQWTMPNLLDFDSVAIFARSGKFCVWSLNSQYVNASSVSVSELQSRSESIVSVSKVEVFVVFDKLSFIW